MWPAPGMVVRRADRYAASLSTTRCAASGECSPVIRCTGILSARYASSGGVSIISARTRRVSWGGSPARPPTNRCHSLPHRPELCRRRNTIAHPTSYAARMRHLLSAETLDAEATLPPLLGDPPPVVVAKTADHLNAK